MALVTGAAMGIGKGIALRLAYDGLDVAVNDIEANGDELDGVAGEIRAKGWRSVAVAAGVSEPDEVQSIVRRVAEELGTASLLRPERSELPRGRAFLSDRSPSAWVDGRRRPALSAGERTG